MGRTAASGSGHPRSRPRSVSFAKPACRSGFDPDRVTDCLAQLPGRPSVGPRREQQSRRGLRNNTRWFSIQGRSISDGGTLCGPCRFRRAATRRGCYSQRLVEGWEGAIDREREAAGHPLGRSPSCATTVCTAVATDSGWLRITKCRAPSTVVRAACGSLRSR